MTIRRHFSAGPASMYGPTGVAQRALTHAIVRGARTDGFAMMEILVTMVIILFGLLGLAGVMARSTTAEMESYQRVQALILVQDMVDRINANRKYAICYAGGSTLTLGTGYVGPPTCTTGASALQQAQAVADLTAWNNALLGSAEATGGTNFGAMIGARGCITQTDAVNNIYRVSVAWQGLAATTASLNDTCGQNAYGTEAQRRVVNVMLRIGKLS